MFNIKNLVNKQDPHFKSVIGLFKTAGALFLIHIILYFLMRILFLSWNYQQLQPLTLTELSIGFWQGFRFDCVIVSVYVFFLILLFEVKPVWLQKSLAILLVLFHGALIFVGFIDIELVNFMGKRFSKASLFLAGEGNLFSFLSYGFLALMTFLGLIFILFFTIIYLKKMRILQTQTSLKSRIFFYVLILPLVLMGSRGGIQYKPLSYIDAQVSALPFAKHFVMNTSYFFIKSFAKSGLKNEIYFESENQLLSYLNSPAKPKLQFLPNQNLSKINVVLIIVESLSESYISKDITPFLYELKSKSIYFDKTYANSRRSLEGLTALLSGVPALIDEPIVNTEFANNSFESLAFLFKRKNYKTSFFHGAKNGSMRFDSYTKAIGFNDYYGLNEFKISKQYQSIIESDAIDPVWGVYDGPFLNFFCESTLTDQPFFQVLFTLSTHQPYHLPASYKSSVQDFRYLKEQMPLLKTVHYFDQSLENYFECAKTKDWFSNTIFIITADHTGPEIRSDRINDFKEKFKIPLLFYTENPTIKKALEALKVHQIAQQIDLIPTMAELLGLDLQSNNFLAQSLFNEGSKSILLYSDQHYELISDQSNNVEVSQNKKPKNDQALKAFKQYFTQGLLKNNLYRKSF